jgi:polysaccharide biosynthesis transport protein
MEKHLIKKDPAAESLDLIAPIDRFEATSRLRVRLHRHQLLLRKYWWALLIILVIPLALAVAITLATPRAYRSEARLWLTGRLDLSEGRLYTEELVNFLGTQADLLRSAPVQKRALARTQQQLPNEQSLKPVPGTLDVIRGLLGKWAAPKHTDDAFPFRLKVAESSKSSILELHVTGAEPNSTRIYLNEVMAEYLNFKRENREKASDRAVSSLAQQVNELAEELKVQQEKMYAFQLSNNVVFLQEQGSGVSGHLTSLNRQLTSLRTELQLLEMIQPEQWVELVPRDRMVPGTEPPPGEPSVQDLMAGLSGPQGDLFRANQRIQLLKAKHEQLSKALRPMHPKILKLDQEIASHEKLVEVSRNEIMRQLVNRREAIGLEVKNLERAFSEGEAEALAASRKMVDYERLRQTVQRTQTAYDKLLAVMSTVDLGKSVDQESLSVLEAASAAAPVNVIVRNIALALVLALVLAAALVWSLDKFDDRFASSTELSQDLSGRVLGQIMNVRLPKADGEMRPEVLSAQRYDFLESFRSIRSALMFMGDNGNRPKTLLVASSVPREGKSTVALYLAATMARGGCNVLLVDGDMRRSKLHRHFDVANSPGLAEILNHEVSAKQAIVTTPLKNLAFLPAGAPSVDPGELVLRSQLTTFLKEVSPRFDYILVDSPPVLAADDASAVASSFDGVLFVVRGASTSARLVREGLATLQQRRARVLGLIFNRAHSSPFEYHPYQRYQRAYGWRAA